jgi:ribosomal protein L7/L12
MYQDIINALLNKTITTEGVQDAIEIARMMKKLGVSLVAGETVKPEASEEAKSAASAVEGHCNVNADDLPLALDEFKEKNKEMGKSIGNKIQLIKLLREQLGLGLADAKHVTERLFGM